MESSETNLELHGSFWCQRIGWPAFFHLLSESSNHFDPLSKLGIEDEVVWHFSVSKSGERMVVASTVDRVRKDETTCTHTYIRMNRLP